MDRRFASLLAVVTAAACTHEFDNPAEQGPQGSIAGTVVARSLAPAELTAPRPRSLRDGGDMGDTGDTVPVQGAVCTLEGTDHSAETDAAGQFVLTAVADGSYILICKRANTDGRAFAVLKVVEVTNGQSVELGTLVATQPGAISGRALLADGLDQTGIEVYIPGTHFSARTDATGAFLMGDVPEGTYTVRFEHEGYLPMQVDGVRVAAVETIELADIILPLSTGASGTIVLAGGLAYVDTWTVPVSVTATADATLMALSEDPSFVGASWQPVATQTEWAFTSDGLKRLYARFANAYGLESLPVSATITIDTTPPVAVALTLADGRAIVRASDITVSVAAYDVSGVTDILLANTEDFAGAEWQPFAVPLPWVLASGDGERHVYVKLRDRFGHESAVASAAVIVDTEAPVEPSIVLQTSVPLPDAEPGYTMMPVVMVQLAAQGAVLALVGESPEALTTSVPAEMFGGMGWSFTSGDGEKTLYAQFFDAADNASAIVSATIIVDSTAPTAPTIFNGDQVTRQTSFSMTLSAPSVDANFKTYEIATNYSPWTPAAPPFSFDLLPMPNRLSVRARDKAGNVGEERSIQVLSDPDPPVVNDLSAPLRGGSGTVVAGKITVRVRFAAQDSGTPIMSCNVAYGPTAAYGSLVPAVADTNAGYGWYMSDLVLDERSTYHYQARCTDAVGNEGASEDRSTVIGMLVAGNLSANTTWAVADSPVWLADNVRVMSGAALTIGPGVEVRGNGRTLNVQGSLVAVGTSGSHIKLDDVTVNAPGTQAAPSTVRIELAEMTGGALLPSTGNVSYFSVTLRDSIIRDTNTSTGSMSLFYPSTDSIIERNVFESAAGFDIWINTGVTLTIRNNRFVQQVSPITVWLCSNGTITVEYNSFLSTDRVALQLGSDGNMTAVNNYFGTTVKSTIDAMIWDANDSVGTTNTLVYEPFLTAPHPDTP